MNTQFSPFDNASAEASPLHSDDMPTSEPTPKCFPHPVHPEIVEALQKEADRLGRAPKWRDLLRFDQYEGFPIEAIRLTLVGLEDKEKPKRSLAPRSYHERKDLIQEGKRLLRCWYKKLGNQAYFDWYRDQKRTTVSLDANPAYEPQCDLYDGFHRAEPHELLEDPLIDELRRKLCAPNGLCSRTPLDDRRAVLFILELISGEDQRDLYELASHMGYRFTSFDAMRKSLSRQKKELKPRIKEFLLNPPATLPADHTRRHTEPSTEGSIIFCLFFISMSRSCSVAAFLRYIPQEEHKMNGGTQNSGDTLATAWYSRQGNRGASTGAPQQTTYVGILATELIADDTQPLRGETLAGRYRLAQPLGAGAFATVYAAKDLSLQRRVAIKVYPAAMGGQLPNAEAHLQATAQHPNLMPLYDTGRDSLLGVTFLVMPLYPGADMAATLNLYGAMPFRPALLCVEQICSALEFLEQRQALHGDVKPANIWLTNSGAALLMDFNVYGLLARPDVGRVGTPGYTAPEALTGRIDARSDVFSLGCVLYTCLTGVAPFADDAAVQSGRYTPLRRLRPEARPALEAIVATALAPDPAQRYQTAREFRNALRFPEREAGLWAGAILPPIRWMCRVAWKATITIYRATWRFLRRFGHHALRHPIQALIELALLWTCALFLNSVAARPALHWLQQHQLQVTAAAIAAPSLLISASCARHTLRHRRPRSRQ